MKKNENATYVNCPLAPRIARTLKAQAMMNGRPAGREGADIITKAIERRIARRQKQVEAKCS